VKNLWKRPNLPLNYGTVVCSGVIGSARTYSYLDIAEEYLTISLRGVTECPGVRDPRQLR